jgi:hypothetical protein
VIQKRSFTLYNMSKYQHPLTIMTITNKPLATTIIINGSVVFGAGVDLAALSSAQLRAILGRLAWSRARRSGGVGF